MMAATTETNTMDQGKTIHIYKNGDIFFSPMKFVINKRNRSYDAFLDDVTSTLKPSFGAVRRLHTPVNGHKIVDLESIVSGRRYVAVGNQRFKRMGYEAIPEGGIFKRSENTSPREIRPVIHSRLKTSGRIRKIRNDPITIFVYKNGDTLNRAVRVLFRKRELCSWDQALSAVAERVTLRTGAVRWIYTLDGTLVEDLSQLKNAEFYIGVGTERFYSELMSQYGQHPALQLSPRSERRKLPPISKPRKSKRRSNATSDNTGSLDNSMDSNKSKQRNRKAESEEDSVFHAKPVKHKRSSEKTRQVDYDKDQGGVYKSKNSNSETAGATQVDETKDTRTDLPIDQVPPEEVKEEVDENKTNNNNNSAKENNTNNETNAVTDNHTDKNNLIQDRSSTPKQQSKEDGTTTPQESPKDENQQQNKEQTEDAAATKIQATYRGYSTRKDLQQQPGGNALSDRAPPDQVNK